MGERVVRGGAPLHVGVLAAGVDGAGVERGGLARRSPAPGRAGGHDPAGRRRPGGRAARGRADGQRRHGDRRPGGHPARAHRPVRHVHPHEDAALPRRHGYVRESRRARLRLAASRLAGNFGQIALALICTRLWLCSRDFSLSPAPISAQLRGQSLVYLTSRSGAPGIGAQAPFLARICVRGGGARQLLIGSPESGNEPKEGDAERVRRRIGACLIPPAH